MGSLLSGPLAGIMEGIGGIIGKFVVDPNEKLKASQELLKIQLDFQAKLLEADAEFAKAQSTVVTAEASSASWMARNWRPILMLTFTYIIAHTYVFAPLFGWTAVVIPDQMWRLLELGMTGYIVGRSAEKTLPAVAQILKK